MDAKNAVKAAAGYLAQTPAQPLQSMPDPQPVQETAPAAPQTIHRTIDVESYHSSSPSQARSVYAPRQIEAAPSDYHSPTYVLTPPTEVSTNPKAIEYIPAHSVAPSQARSQFSVARSATCPELLTIGKAKSIASNSKPQSVVSVSKARSIAPSAAPSTLISSFVPDHEPRRSSEGSVHSHHSSKSKAKSSCSKSSRSRHEEAIESSPSPPPPGSKAPSKAPSKAASIVSSILGRDRDSKSKASKQDDFIDDLEIDELTEDDLDTVVPSDSISQAGSSRRHRSHRSRKHSDGSVVSKHSSTSKHSKHSSHRSHRSHKSRTHHDSDDENASRHSSESKSRRSHRPSVVSEPSDASTIKPVKSSSRKDSVTQGQYDDLFDEVQYGTGSVAVRGITPSMISAAGKNKNRSMTNYNLAQKLRAFEGS